MAHQGNRNIDQIQTGAPLKDDREKMARRQRAMELSRRWLGGIPYEVAFWRSYYRNRRAHKALMSWSLLGKECVLDNFDIASFVSELGRENPVIADVGCALSYTFSNIIGGKTYDIAYVDPLAPFYNRILDDYRQTLPRITFGMGETLSHIFPRSSVSLLHIRNALDHSLSPMLVIRQALICLHVGGILYLNHKPNEAEHEAYIGFHQYNIDCQDGRLIIWNKEERIDVGKELREVAEVETSVTDDGRVVAVIRKTAEPEEDTRIISESSEYAMGMLQDIIIYHHSLPRASAYQWKRGLFTVGHGVMRLLPWGLVRKIKETVSGKKAGQR